MSYVKRLETICNQLIEFFGWETIEEQTRKFEETGSRSRGASENLQKIVFEGLTLMHTNYAVAITQLYNNIPSSRGYDTSFCDYITARGARDFEPDRIEQLTKYMHIIGDIVVLYEEWDKDQFQPIIDNIKTHDLFDKKKEGPEVTPQLIQKIHDLIVTKEKFQIYKYRSGNGVMKSTDSWKISKEIGFSQDLTQWLRHVDSQKEFLESQPEDEVFVTLFGKIDEVSDLYSNWVITLHKKDTVWLITDQISFDNPMQKRSRLERVSVWKDADEMASVCDLPYHLFDELDEIRKKQTGLVSTDKYEQELRPYLKEAKDQLNVRSYWDDGAKKVFNTATHLMKVDLEKKGIKYDICFPDYTTGTFGELETIEARYKGRMVAKWHEKDELLRVYRVDEFLFMDMHDLSESAKLFMLLIPGKLIEVITSEGYETPEVLLSGEFVERKLIEGDVIKTANPDHLEFWEEDHQTIFKGLLNTMESLYGHSTALMPQSYTSIIKTEYYNESWLSTIEQHESLSEWLIAESQVNLIRPRWYRLREREKQDKAMLYEMLNDKKYGVMERLLKSKSATFYDNVERSDGGSFGGSWKRDSKHEQGGGFISTSYRATEQYKKGLGIGKTKWEAEMCSCNNNDVKVVKIVHITHYRELMWVLGCKREALPPYYQNYRGYGRVPYSGNSLLNQVHPFANIEDPCSKSHEGGLHFRMYKCNDCIKKLNKGPAEVDIKITTKLKKFL